MASKKEFTEQEVLAALGTVMDPDLHRSVTSMGMIKDIDVNGNALSFTFELTTPACPLKDTLENDARKALKNAIPAIGDIKINWTSKVIGQMDTRKEAVLPGVKNTIAVASGKGGVGKSTVAVNIAVALAKDGAKVGFIDADIYGPSAPLMFGLNRKQPAVINMDGAKKLVPLDAHGVKVMSIGFLVDPDTAVVWRGPMASGALKQFMSDVTWGELDYLVFDMPPGTGDIQLTLAQTIPLTGAIIVTTPQDISLADARKGYRMFENLHVPVFGIVENMSYFKCPDCGHRSEIFSYGGGKKAAEELHVPFLGEVPIDLQVRIGSDEGVPVVSSHPQSEDGQAFISIARNVAAQVSIRNANAGNQEPKIILD
ncbi:MAG TPA: iron-sulfur cluster carrier protein ApbC [Candidatus Kapabacteria bacterium]|nr:iron-sulfur cluster carrier protein ApbC [Candidatus Kapabacteria bacterium]